MTISRDTGDRGHLASNPNLFINGNFDVWQRGTGPFTGGYGPDRWIQGLSGATAGHGIATFTIGQTDVPNGPTNYHQTYISASSGSSDAVNLQQRLEGVKRYAGRTLTLTFWSKSSTNNLYIEWRQNFGSGGSTEVDGTVSGTKFAAGSVWTKHTFSFTLPSIAGKTQGSAPFTNIIIWMSAGSTFDARTDSLGNQTGYFDFAQAKLEFGPVATPFIPADFAWELNQCKRFYETGSDTYSGDCTATATYYSAIKYMVPKRGTPTVVLTATSQNAFSASRGQTSVGTLGYFISCVSTVTAAAGNFSTSWTATAEL